MIAMTPTISSEIEQPRQACARRVLMISYHFPPVGGAGVQRPVKFAKFLRQHGWDVSVLVAANPSVPVLDHSLCRDLPEDLVVERARTWEPDYRVKQQYGQATQARVGLLAGVKGLARGLVKRAASLLLQPDPQVLWLPNALSVAKRLLKQLPHDAILATAPSYSNLVLGAMLKKRTGLPLVVDYRDEWDLSNKYLENSRRDWFSHVVQERMQRQVLRRADAIIGTTQGSTARLQERAVQAGGRASAFCIYNGFDPADFHLPIEKHGAADQVRFRMVYTGTLWNLTNVQPVVEAVERLHRESPELLDRLELVFVGRKTPEQLALLNRLTATRCRLDVRDYCDHSTALQLMAEADALCLLLSDVPGAERVAPAKLFEYLAWRKPILAVVPQGETADIVRRYFPRNQFQPSDTAGIAHWLCDQLAVFPATGQSELEEAPQADLTEFTRSYQAGQLAHVLNDVVSSQKPS